jgi:hypothetical protein
MARKLTRMRNKHAITLEWLRMGALKGVIENSNGSTIYDLYAEFGIQKKVINCALNNAATDVLGWTLDMKAWIEDHLFGETMRSILVLCSASFFRALTSHANVTKAFTYYMANNQNLAGDYRLGFNFGGSADSPVLFREYRGRASDPSGELRYFLPDKGAIAFPLGTIDTFRTFFAPADFTETANSPGLELYAKPAHAVEPAPDLQAARVARHPHYAVVRRPSQTSYARQLVGRPSGVARRDCVSPGGRAIVTRFRCGGPSWPTCHRHQQ